MVVMDIFTRRIIGFGVAAANLDGPGVCWMFNRAIAKQHMPKHLSSDHDPCFVFQPGWRTFGSLRLTRSNRFLAHPVRILSSSG